MARIHLRGVAFAWAEKISRMGAICVAWVGIAVGGALGCTTEPPAVKETVGEHREHLYSDVSGFGPLNGVEWQVDTPWRLEPSASDRSYDPVPIVMTFHDARNQDTFDQDPLPIGAVCSLYVVEGGHVTRFGPEEFHEIEASRRWLNTGELTPGNDSHLLRRMWDGESPDDVVRINDWAEWNATALYQPRSQSPGEDLELIVMVRVAGTAGCHPNQDMDRQAVLWQLMRGRESSGVNVGRPSAGQGVVERDAEVYFFGDFLKVHLAEAPLPKFSDEWVYGDLHYHSQGTDNEGESGTSYRTVGQAMKSMGLDYVFATDHASDSHQITGFHQIFVDNIPILPSWLDFVEDWLVNTLRDAGAGVPVDRADALRDLSDNRFRYLYDWLNLPSGANHEVRRSGGSNRAPQVFIGAELDVIPEISDEERQLGRFRYAFDRFYRWRDVCTDLPSALIEWTDFEGRCEHEIIYDGSTPHQWSLRDPQGLGQIKASRQHMVYLPYDSDEPGAINGRDSFISGNTTTYGGANRRLGELLNTELEVAKKGYVFLAHPVEKASGNGVNRLGPDIVPFSDTQLRTAFNSPYVLGLQLWNSDTRHKSVAGSRRFPMLHDQGVPDPELDGHVVVNFDWRWEEQDEQGLWVELGDGARMWDQVLKWGINPTKTADLEWLADGAPRKFFMAGGSDAHGDLNYRRTGRFFGWAAANDTAIGKPRNLTYVGTERPGASGGVGQNQVVESLASGRFAVTDGPALRIAIDVNGNGTIDDGDVPMGGDFIITEASAPVLVEWKSTPEFGPVKTIDFYVGVQSSDHEGLVYAPAGHGTTGSGQCIESDTVITDDTGREYCPMRDGYVRDPNGNLQLTIPRSEGYAGTRILNLRPTDFNVFDHECVTEHDTIRDDDGTLIPISFTRCRAIDVQTPARLYTRAFAETEGRGVLLRRYAFTNPIWMTARQVASPPNIELEHQSCASGTNRFRATATPGIISGTISTKQLRIGTGAWRTLSGNSFTSSGGQRVEVRARACNENGCSAFSSQSLVGPACIPPRPDSPSVHLEFVGCSRGTNSFISTVSPRGSVSATSMDEEFKIASGSWRTLSSPIIHAGSRQRVYLRARSCNAQGCSAYTSTSRSGPYCGTGGGGGPHPL